MSAHVEAKKQIVEEIKAKIQASKSIVLADYNKLTVLEVTALRNKFKEANCEYKVYKNTLVRKAFNDLGITDFDNDLNGTAWKPTRRTRSPRWTRATGCPRSSRRCSTSRTRASTA